MGDTTRYECGIMSYSLRVGDIMSEAVTAGPESTLAKTIQMMNERSIGHAVVLGESGPIGIITERDILKAVVKPGFNLESILVKDVMSSKLITIRKDAPVEQAAAKMATYGIRRLPVLNSGELVGIVTAMDIVRATPRMGDLMDETLKHIDGLLVRKKRRTI